MSKSQIIAKMAKVINSCTTFDQLNVAKKYCVFALRRTANNWFDQMDIAYDIDRDIERQKEYIQAQVNLTVFD
jgi:hypothetical protein